MTDPDQKVYPMMIQTTEGCYAIAQATYGNNAGDKSQPNWDNTLSSTDFWIIRYCDTSASTTAAFTASNEICPGTCIDFTNLSTSATSYTWFFPGSAMTTSTDANPQGVCYTNPGSYDVTLIAFGASGIDTLIMTNFITVYPYPPPQGIIQSGDTLNANQGAVSYQWYHDGNIIPGATNFSYIATASGNYNVVAVDSNGCEVEAAIFDVIAAVPGFSPGNDPGVKLFPNPADGTLSVTSQSPINDLKITDVLGKNILVVYKYKQNNRNIEVDVHNLPAAVYFITLTETENVTRVKFEKK